MDASEHRVFVVGGDHDGAHGDPTGIASFAEQREGHAELTELLRVARNVDLDGVAGHAHLLRCLNALSTVGPNWSSSAAAAASVASVNTTLKCGALLVGTSS